MPLAPTPLAPTSAAAAVADTLRQAIVNGDLCPGEQLRQEAVARHLGVSRQPVREALRLLKAEGVLVEGPGRSTVVRSYGVDYIHENFHLRSVLEGEAARYAAQRISTSELEALQQLHLERRLVVESDMVPRALELNRQFHAQVRRAAHMPTMERIIDDLVVGYMSAVPHLPLGRLAESQAEHTELIAALRNHDSDRAATAMTTHIMGGLRAYCMTWPELAALQG